MTKAVDYVLMHFQKPLLLPLNAQCPQSCTSHRHPPMPATLTFS